MISVITAYHNSHEFIGKTYDSLKAQSVGGWEWIIVDDGSQPESLAALHDIVGDDDRVRVFSQTNAGQGSARNLGAKEAKGDYLCFLDSDDWFERRKLEKQSAYMGEHQVDISFTEVEGVRLGGCRENFSGASAFDPVGGRQLLPDLISSCRFTLSSVMMTRSCFDELGGFSAASHFRGTEDYELWVRAAVADKTFAIIAGPLTYYAIRQGSEVRDLTRSYDGALRAIGMLKNDADPYVRKVACERSVSLAGRLILRAVAASRIDVARYWAGEEPRALLGISRIVMMGDGRLFAWLLNILYAIKRRIR